MAQGWHRTIYRGVPVPLPYYVGEVRDSDQRFPELIGYGVQVGAARGVRSADVPQALTAYEAGMRAAVARVDVLIPAGQRPLDAAHLTAVNVYGDSAGRDRYRDKSSGRRSSRGRRLYRGRGTVLRRH